MFQAALQGFLLCCGLILPLGVQNTFVFSQGAVQRRWVKGLPVVVTAALCDTLLITAAVGGVSLIVLTLSWFRAALGWVGVGFLAVVGWFTWHADSGSEPAGREAAEWPLSRQITFAASVSLLNPHAILDTIGVVGTTALRFPVGPERLAYTLACIAVSWLWFLGLMTAGHLLGTLGPQQRFRRWLNRASALIIWFVGWQLFSGLLGG
jgi:L-lysine exporter family protein LysE/ArgO